MKISYIGRPSFHLSAIVFAVFLIYSNTLNAPFQFDDIDNIVYNPAIKDLGFFSGWDTNNDIAVSKHVGPILQSRLIGYLTFAINYKLFGLKVQGYHILNILIHASSSLLLYWLVKLTLMTPFFTAGGKPLFPDSSKNFIAFFTSLFFAVHPIQTQAVTYIVQRFTSLAALFYLLSFATYIKFRICGRETSISSTTSAGAKNLSMAFAIYSFSLISALLAMKTKEFAFTLPFALTLHEIMFFQGNARRRALYLAPFFLATLIIPLSLGANLTGVNGMDEAVSVFGTQEIISWKDYLFTEFRVIVTYIRLLFFPINQNLDYDYPIYTSFFTPEIMISFIFLLAILATACYMLRLSVSAFGEDRYSMRLASFGIFWFFIALSAESGIIPIADVIFEHRLYLPSAGFFMSLTAVSEIAVRKTAFRISHGRGIILTVLIAVVLVLSAATYKRNGLWTDIVRFSEDVVNKSPDKSRAHYHLGLVYHENGRLDEAIREYNTALSLKNNLVFMSDIYNNLGTIYSQQGDVDKAVRAYESALRINYDDADIHYNLANAYALQKRTAEAILEYRATLRINPGDPKTHYYLARAYENQGQIDEAVSEYEIVLTMNPRDERTRNRLRDLRKQMTK